MKDEEANRILADYDERVWDVIGWDSVLNSIWVEWRDGRQQSNSMRLDYCSSDSPRSLLEGIEKQLTPKQMVRYSDYLCEGLSAESAIWDSPQGLIVWGAKLSGRTKAHALASVVTELEWGER